MENSVDFTYIASIETYFAHNHLTYILSFNYGGTQLFNFYFEVRILFLVVYLDYTARILAALY